MKRNMSLIVLVSISIALLAQAPPKPEPDPCVNPQNTFDMRVCASKQYKDADAELNRVYKIVMSALDDDEQKSLLRKAQLAWLQYRDANAEYQADLYRGGSIAPQIKLQCLADMTKARTAELKLTYDEDLDN